jgi:hypothetical protein
LIANENGRAVDNAGGCISFAENDAASGPVRAAVRIKGARDFVILLRQFVG